MGNCVIEVVYSLQIQGMDVGKHVFYLAFSRILPPAFRISYLVLPLPYLKEYEKHKKSYAPIPSK